MSAIKEFKLSLDELEFFSEGLHRPESVLAEKDGTLWVSDTRGLVSKIGSDGSQSLVGSAGHEPNGLAMDRDGNIYNANIGDGKIYKLLPDGTQEVVLDEIDGQPLGAPNFVFLDSQDRLWISISTRESIWFMAASNPRPDGYIILIDESGPRIVGDGIFFPNEIRLDADEKYLYVAETMQSRMLRYPVNADGSLGDQEVFGPDNLGFGAFVDGFTFDSEGNIWVTTVLRNGLMIITPDGEAHTVFEDVNDSALENAATKLAAGTMTPDDMFACVGPKLQVPASVTFAGEDLKTVYIGSLAMPHLVTFRSPVAGLPMRHW
ncbi:MAG: SMP-30/gluconolactonase/LRE family protein [Chloroflexota bacterium]